MTKSLTVEGNANMELIGEHNFLAFDEFSMLGPVKVRLSETKEKLKLEFR